jgi:putative acyl-CoA dehydrogenase
MKDKMGTRQLPTAEILLKGTDAYLLGDEGKGVKMISKMLTVTRLYNSATAVGLMRRGIALVRDYSDRRMIGKHKLADLLLHMRVLSDLDVIHRGNLIFYLKIS